MGLAALAIGAAAVAAYAVQHPARPSFLDPYTAWMVSNLPNPRAWHR